MTRRGHGRATICVGSGSGSLGGDAVTLALVAARSWCYPPPSDRSRRRRAAHARRAHPIRPDRGLTAVASNLRRRRPPDPITRTIPVGCAADAWPVREPDPAERRSGQATEVIVWGGWVGRPFGVGPPQPDGAAYDPVQDRWRRIPEAPIPAERRRACGMDGPRDARLGRLAPGRAAAAGAERRRL